MRIFMSALFFYSCGILSLGEAVAKTDCQTLKPEVAGYHTVHGVVRSQMEIDPSAPGRLRPQEGSRSIEIERLWGLGQKAIHLETPMEGAYVHSIRWTFFLKSDRIQGVKIWTVDVGGEDLRPEGRPWMIERGAQDRWTYLDFNLLRPRRASSEFTFNFYARTIFKNPVSPRNIATGTRVDACVFFLVR